MVPDEHPVELCIPAVKLNRSSPALSRVSASPRISERSFSTKLEKRASFSTDGGSTATNPVANPSQIGLITALSSSLKIEQESRCFDRSRCIRLLHESLVKIHEVLLKRKAILNGHTSEIIGINSLTVAKEIVDTNLQAASESIKSRLSDTSLLLQSSIVDTEFLTYENLIHNVLVELHSVIYTDEHKRLVEMQEKCSHSIIHFQTENDQVKTSLRNARNQISLFEEEVHHLTQSSTTLSQQNKQIQSNLDESRLQNLVLESNLVDLKLMMMNWRSSLVSDILHECHANIANDIRSIFGYLPRGIHLKFELFEREVTDYLKLPFDDTKLTQGDDNNDDDDDKHKCCNGHAVVADNDDDNDNNFNIMSPGSSTSTCTQTEATTKNNKVSHSSQTEDDNGDGDDEAAVAVPLMTKKVKIIKRRKRKQKTRSASRDAIDMSERKLWK